ncbi:putative colanic acid biosynthesis acetyltransferase [Altererythrobacter sp. MF3-039]|uniref:putative colanic acid biosynthesis acetyltransferase n=1 Tax=Altererythrobacter sp. MF3-039 TaxID=3252901 RepID=UPI00390CDA7B
MAEWSDFRPMGDGAAFGLANKLERVLWQISWLLLARWTPPPLFAWRNLILRAFGAKIGKRARIYGDVRVWLPRHLAMGDEAIVGRGVELYNQGTITIGPRTVISQRAHICASTHDASDPDFKLLVRPIVIREACWVAAEAFVGPGVTMGEGSVLAARGALFEDAEPMTIYRGNPAVAVKERTLRS